MPTKTSLALGPRRPVSRQVAWGCLTTNLTLPGFGSLVAGRAVGYAQIVISLAGFALTTVFGIRFILWFFSNWTRLQQLQDDPGRYFGEIWLALRWALLGMALFLAALLWALLTSLSILAEARAAEVLNPPRVPPKI